MAQVCVIALVILCISRSLLAQDGSNSEKLDSCNVVCNCNTNPSDDLHHSRTSKATLQGVPGKRGPEGERGLVGPKGQKGEIGAKGQQGQRGVSAAEILSAMGAISCQELKVKYGVSSSGFYILRNDRTPEYHYCDFTEYEGVSNCTELTERYNITLDGYYSFTSVASERRVFRYCSAVITDVYTCQRLKDVYSVEKTGFYRFKTRGSEPSRVFCDFNENPAVTEIMHNMLNEVEIPERTCGGQGCHTGAPVYDVNFSDITRIIENSVSCKQFIKLRCRGVLLKRDGYAWWVSRDGNKMLYWGGTQRDNYCACGETNTCIDNAYQCNCDQNSRSIETSDEGYLTDKTKLPVKQIRIGDIDDAGEKAWYTIGKLECTGQV